MPLLSVIVRRQHCVLLHQLHEQPRHFLPTLHTKHIKTTDCNDAGDGCIARCCAPGDLGRWLHALDVIGGNLTEI